MPRDQIRYDDLTSRVGNGGDKSGSLSPFTFLCFVLVLVLFGLVVLYSISFPIAVREGLPHYHYFAMQCIAAGGGFLAGIGLYFLPLRALRKSYLILYPLAAAACVLSFFPGFSDGGYIVLGGIQVVQPGSLALIAGAFLASDAIPEAGSIGGGIVREYLLSFIFLTALLALTLFSSGLPWFIMLAAIILAAYAVKGTGRAAVLLILVLIASGGAVAFFSCDFISAPVMASILPVDDPSFYDQDLYRALASFSDGGIAGKGLGSGLEHPFQYADAYGLLIFPSLARELGANGCAFVVLLFAFVSVLGIRTASRACRKDDRASASLAISLTLIIVLKAAFDMLYASGLLPLGGVMLPFFSFSVQEEAINVALSVLLYRLIYMIGRENAQD